VTLYLDRDGGDLRWGTRDRHKKVVRCITNVSVAVVHLRGRPSQNKCFPPMLCK